MDHGPSWHDASNEVRLARIAFPSTWDREIDWRSFRADVVYFDGFDHFIGIDGLPHRVPVTDGTRTPWVAKSSDEILNDMSRALGGGFTR